MFVSSSILFFNVWNIVNFLMCEKLFTELHPVCIAGSKQQIGNRHFEDNTCFEIYL